VLSCRLQGRHGLVYREVNRQHVADGWWLGIRYVRVLLAKTCAWIS